MQNGIVKVWKPQGWGFITPEGGGADIFVHYSSLQGRGMRNLVEGERVQFETGIGDRGPYASYVIRLGMPVEVNE